MKKTYKIDSLSVQFKENIEYIENDWVKEKLATYFERLVDSLEPNAFELLYNENIGGADLSEKPCILKLNVNRGKQAQGSPRTPRKGVLSDPTPNVRGNGLRRLKHQKKGLR